MRLQSHLVQSIGFQKAQPCLSDDPVVEFFDIALILQIAIAAVGCSRRPLYASSGPNHEATYFRWFEPGWAVIVGCRCRADREWSPFDTRQLEAAVRSIVAVVTSDIVEIAVLDAEGSEALEKSLSPRRQSSPNLVEIARRR